MRSSDVKGRPGLGTYVRQGLQVAAGLCVVAVLGIGIGSTIAARSGIGFPAMGEFFGGVLVIFVSYFVAAVVAAVALWLIFPLGKSFLAFILRGAVLAPIAYGILFVALVILYMQTGINVLEFESADHAWAFLRWSMPVLPAIGGLIWGPIFYLQYGAKQS